MPPMDYSKWGTMSFDEDDEDDRPRKPRVTRLDGPSQITLGSELPVSQPAAGVPHNYTTDGSSKSAGRSSKLNDVKPKSSFD
jgi:hypothetical protein